MEFEKDGIAYGILYPMGGETPRWEINFYSSESGRKRGIRYLRTLFGSYCTILTFEVTLKELRLRASLIPGVPDEKQRDFVDVVKAELRLRHKKINEN